MDGWMDGSKSRFKDYLQRSEIMRREAGGCGQCNELIEIENQTIKYETKPWWLSSLGRHTISGVFLVHAQG